MEMDALWMVALTAVSGFIIWWAKSQHEELKRVTILLNRTREEYRTKEEANTDMSRVLDRLDRLNEKLDRLMEIKTKYNYHGRGRIWTP